MFKLYINDLLQELPINSILFYTDDTIVISSGKTWIDAQTKMNKFLHITQKWLQVNQLPLNLGKTVYMIFGSYNDSIPKQ